MRLNVVFALVATAAVVVAVVALFMFRYDYHSEMGGYMVRIDRFTGAVCAYPTNRLVRMVFAQTSELEVCPPK
jgi:hypothetical protein